MNVERKQPEGEEAVANPIHMLRVPPLMPSRVTFLAAVGWKLGTLPANLSQTFDVVRSHVEDGNSVKHISISECKLVLSHQDTRKKKSKEEENEAERTMC
jgi:hypothetical protein